MRPRAQTALTLIELLVAAALFAVLGVLLFQLVRGALDVWATGERNRELSERASTAFELLAEDLRAAWAGVPGQSPTDARFVCEWRDENVDGQPGRRVPLLRFSRLAHEARRLPWLAAAGDTPGGTQATALIEAGDPAELLPTSGLAESLYTLARLPGREGFSLVRRVRAPLGGSGSLLAPGLAQDPGLLLSGAVEIADRILHFGVACFAPETVEWDEAAASPGSLPEQALAPTEWDSSPEAATAEGRRRGFPRLVRVTLVLDPHAAGRGGAALEQELGLLDTTLRLRVGPSPGDGSELDHVLIGDEWLAVTAQQGRELTVRRGVRGSSPAEHAAGTRVRAGRAFERVLALPAAREVLDP